MPEGHIIERIAREHRALLAGDSLAVSSPQGRFAAGAALLDGARLIAIHAHGKHSFHRFRRDDEPPAADRLMHVHLGLYGKWLMGSADLPPTHGAIRVQLVGHRGWAQLRGAARCEVVSRAEMREVVARLGEDPLHSRQAGRQAFERLQRTTRAIGLVMMDQSIVAGVGNVYRAEVLFRHRMSPFRPASVVSDQEWAQVWADLSRLMRAGVRRGRIITTERADRSKRRGDPTYEDQYYVYRRTGLPCRLCGTPVRAENAAGRTLYWCEVCQAA